MEQSAGMRFPGSLKVCALPLMFAAALNAQTFGEITGRVSDASGAAAAGAAVTITNVATNAVRSTITNDSGDYNLPSVPPGAYDVKVERQGFKTEATKNVEVQVQQTLRLDFTLQVGQVSESIEVVASAASLQSENSTVGTVIENKEHRRAAAERAAIPEPGRTGAQHEHAFTGRRPGGIATGRRPRQSVDLGRRAAHHVRLLHARRREQYGSEFQHLRRAAVDRRAAGIQGADRRLSGRVRASRPPRSTCSPSPAAISITVRFFEFLRNDKLDADALLVHQQAAGEIAVQVERLWLRTRRSGAHSEALQRTEQAILHGQLRSAAAAAELPEHLLGAHRRDVQRRFQRDLIGHLRSQHQGALRRQRHSHQPHRSDLEEAGAILCAGQRAWSRPGQQFRALRRLAAEPRRLRAAHGFRRIVQIAVVGPL